MTTTLDLPIWSDLSSDERRDLIKPLWDAGKSAGDITRYFIGASRNAIIGVVHRSKWQRAPSVSKANSDRANKMRRKAAPNPQVKRKPVAALREEPDIKVDKVDWIHTERPPLPGTVPVRMIDLPTREGGMCRFPVIGGYCGVHTGEDKYCEAHHRFMYQVRKE